MPRWVEAMGLLLVAVVAVGLILVWARMRARDVEQTEEVTRLRLEQSKDIPSLPENLLANVPPASPREVPTVASLQRMAPGPVALGPGQDAPGAVVLGPGQDAALAPADPPPIVAPGAADAGLALAAPDVVQAPPDLDVIQAPLGDDPDAAGGPVPEAALDAPDAVTAADALDDAETPDAQSDDARALAAGDRDAGAKSAAPPISAAQEAQLLQAAHASLERLYALRLRTDIPPAAVEEEAQRFRAAMDALPDARRAELGKLLDAGYRALPSRPTGGPTQGALDGGGVGVAPANAGQRDVPPPDLRGLSEALDGARKRAGLPAPPPAPPPQTAPTLPSAAPTSLDGVQAQPL